MPIKDYNDFFNDYDAAQERELSKRPVCENCGEHIQEEQFYRIGDTYICLNCIDEYLEDTESYIEE